MQYDNEKDFFSVFLLVLVSCSPQKQSDSDIISYFDTNPDSVTVYDICRLNLALGDKGELADRAFEYPQAGYSGLLPEWNYNVQVGQYLSDVYFSMGLVALSQRMAFESMVLDDRRDNPDMLKRLVQTNLIFGAYPVAGKYLDLLATMPGECSWVREYRNFLDDAAAVEADSILGQKRRCIPKDDFASSLGGIEKLNTKTPRTISALVYPQWDNTGRYVAFSVNDIFQFFLSSDKNRVEVYDTKSDVVVYEVGNHQLSFSPLTMAEDKFETFPTFSQTAGGFISAQQL